MEKCTFIPYEGKEPYVFISYSHKDSPKVLPILEHLNKSGFRIWYDDGIEWGTEWPDYIASHLSKCSVCMAFISSNSILSPNCKREIYFALKRRKGILSVYLEEVELSEGMDMELSSFQATYLFQYNDDMDAFCSRLEKLTLLECCRKRDNEWQDSDQKKGSQELQYILIGEERHSNPIMRAWRKITASSAVKHLADIENRAQKGDAAVQTLLGRFYYYGHMGMEKRVPDYAKAVQWFLRAAAQEDKEAQYMLGVCFQNGEGVSQNISEAVRWYKKAAEQGFSRAGEALRALENLERIKWLAEEGNAKAQYALGYYYERGYGVKENSETAKAWYQKSAHQGHAEAIWSLKDLDQDYSYDDMDVFEENEN